MGNGSEWVETSRRQTTRRLRAALAAIGSPIEVTVTNDVDCNDQNGGIDDRGDFVGRMTLPAGTTTASVR